MDKETFSQKCQDLIALKMQYSFCRTLHVTDGHFDLMVTVFNLQIENLQEQLRDKEKQMSSLKERVKSLQADTSNTDTALTTLEESLSEKVKLQVTHMCAY